MIIISRELERSECRVGVWVCFTSLVIDDRLMQYTLETQWMKNLYEQKWINLLIILSIIPKNLTESEVI